MKLSYCPRMEEVNEYGETENVWQDWGIFEDDEKEALRVAEEVKKQIAKGKWKDRAGKGCHLEMCVEVHDDNDNYRLLEIMEL